MDVKQPGSVEDAPVLRTASGSVVTLTLNRPAQYNALSSDMLAALQQALESASRDPACSVLVLAASGKAFCAGHDLREMRANPAESWQNELFNRCSRLMLTIAELQQPVIAAVQGVATAAGCQLVASCDLAVAARSARFATSGINLGLFCSTPAVALSRSLAPKHAAEMLLTGEFVDAEQAAAWGLVNRCVDDNCLMQEVQSLADQLASKSRYALASGKRLLRQLRQGQGYPLDAAYQLAAGNMASDMQSGDAQAGIDAFIAKRPMPAWSGR
ncbi:enoyl-CoA hydratase [Casimicrobium huifangae]|jgi:enoyl-CoA hydratase/carnithine racemase|uniref:enoyl-CoA hydratase n=1 Tax=Casimicrobium huifangae TaxID=2591109 RepID=UPI0012EBB8C2|nr:enoyl-CoA hydratase [Casimicrobium huifangae]